MCVNATVGDAGLFLLVDIVDAEPGVRPSEALSHQDGAQILAGRSADSDDPAIAVPVLLLTDDRPSCSQCLQPSRCEAARRPSVTAWPRERRCPIGDR
jgi:hypothetical protein